MGCAPPAARFDHPKREGPRGQQSPQSLGVPKTRSRNSRLRREGRDAIGSPSPPMNIANLAKVGHKFFAVQIRGRRVVQATNPGDRCILYCAQAGSRQATIGEFEITSAALDEESNFPGALSSITSSYPGETICLSPDSPINIASILDQLQFVTNKKYFGLSLKTDFRSIPEADYQLISRLLNKSSSSERGLRETLNIGEYVLNTVVLGDSNSLVSGLPDNSIDVVVTSPPYWGQRTSLGSGTEPDPRAVLELTDFSLYSHTTEA